MFNLFQDFSPYVTVVAPTAVFAFTRPYEDLTECPNCKEARFKANGKPHKYFDYIPIIPRLQAMSANSIYAKKMHYRANHVHEPGTIKDIFDGSHYQTLLNTIVPTGEANPFFYFSNRCNIDLGLSTDGFHSKRLIRRVGPLFLLTTISLLKYVSKSNIASTLPQSWVQKSFGIGIPFVGHLFKS